MYRQDAAPDRSILVTAFNATIFGIDRATGEIRWTVSDVFTGGILELALEEDVLIAASSEKLGFVEYATGRVLAVVDIEGEHPRRPTMLVADGHVYIGRNGELSCYTTRGQRVWYQPFHLKGFGSMALALPGIVRQADDIGGR
ncbi:MAG: PQQ-binding-like beta-propeller repeat protein [Deltaproteobacteria bacterium]|nr:PQQ-binding-like beta-propeller repeat protein [Deltaproteobacteria bacterium]